MNTSYETGRASVTIGSRERRVPGIVRDTEEVGERLAVSITPAAHYGADLSDAVGRAAFDLPAPARNVVAFDESGEVAWTVGRPVHSTGGDHFRDLSLVAGRLLASDSTDHCYELDPETGAILGDWPETELPIGERIASFASPIEDYFQVDDLVVIQEGVTGATVYGFETDGSVRWQQNGRSGVELQDGVLTETVVPNDSRRATLRIDPETGKRVAVLKSDLPDAESYLAPSER